MWPFTKKIQEEEKDSDYIKLLKQKLKFEKQKSDQSSNIYDIAAGAASLAVGIAVVALGSAITAGAPAIAIGLIGGSFAVYKEYKRRKVDREIKKLDAQIEIIEKKNPYHDDFREANQIKKEINQVEHKERKVSNLLEIAIGTFSTTSNIANIAIFGTIGVAGVLLPYGSLLVAAIGVGVFSYSEYKRRKEAKKYNDRSQDLGDIELVDMSKNRQQDLEPELGKIDIPKNQTLPQEQSKPKRRFLDFIYPRKKDLSFAQSVKAEEKPDIELGK